MFTSFVFIPLKSTVSKVTPFNQMKTQGIKQNALQFSTTFSSFFPLFYIARFVSDVSVTTKPGTLPPDFPYFTTQISLVNFFVVEESQLERLVSFVLVLVLVLVLALVRTRVI